MNEFLKNFHVVVFLKQLQLRIQEDLKFIEVSLRQRSVGDLYNSYVFENLIRWIEHYPDRGIPDIIEIKESRVQKFKQLSENRRKM